MTTPVIKFMAAPAHRMIIFLHLQGAEAADGQGPQAVESLSLPPLEQGGTHAHGKLVHLYPQQLGRGEVPQLVGGHQNTENQNRDDDIEHKTGTSKKWVVRPISCLLRNWV